MSLSSLQAHGEEAAAAAAVAHHVLETVVSRGMLVVEPRAFCLC